MKPNNTDYWAVVAASAPRESDPIHGELPYGFSTQMVSRWRAAQKDEKLRCWSLWSLRAALASMTVCGIVAGMGALRNDSHILVSPLPSEFVAPPFTLQ